MTFTPYPSQVDDLNKLRANNYTGCLAIEMGGGKTVDALMATKDSGAAQTLIIAPQSTHKKAWREDAELVMGEEVRIIGNSLKAEKQAMSDLQWGYPGLYIVTPQLFTREDSTSWTPDMLIVDESHMLNNPKAAGQRKLSGYQVKDKPISRRSGMRLALSGTHARNNFERMWATCRFLWPELNGRGEVAYDNYYGWLHERMTSEDIVKGFKWYKVSWDRYEKRQPGQYAKIVEGVPYFGEPDTAKKWLTEAEPGRLFEEMPCVIQHFRRRECCVHHPEGFLKHEEPNVTTRTVEISAQQKRIIRDLENQGLAWLDEHPLSVQLPMTLQQRIRQTTLAVPTLVENGGIDEFGNPITELFFKHDAVSPFADEVDEILESWEDETVCIFLSSQRFASALTERLKRKGESVFEYSGAISKSEREKNLARFGTDFRIMVATLESVGTGTDGIQKVCNNEIWIERSLDETVNTQGEGRTDRIGSRAQTQRVYIEDDTGYAAGRFSKQMTKRLALAESTKVKVR